MAVADTNMNSICKALGTAALMLAALPANTLKYCYDDAGRLTNVDYGDGKSIAYTYDNAGNLLSRVVTAGEQSPADRKSKADKGARYLLKSKFPPQNNALEQTVHPYVKGESHRGRSRQP
jgi:YD repeat-containing protein